MAPKNKNIHFLRCNLSMPLATSVPGSSERLREIIFKSHFSFGFPILLFNFFKIYFFIRFIYFILYVSVLSVCMCVTCVLGVHGGQKRTLDPLELELMDGGYEPPFGY